MDTLTGVMSNGPACPETFVVGMGEGEKNRRIWVHDYSSYLLKSWLAIIPARGGKIKVETRRIKVSRGPTMASSRGRRVTAHNDQAVTKATTGPIPAPELYNTATRG